MKDDAPVIPFRRLRVSTCVMYASVAALLLSWIACSIAVPLDSFEAAGRSVIFLGVGYVTVVGLGVPAALYSKLTAFRNAHLVDTGATVAARWLVCVAVVVPLLWFWSYQ